MYCPRPVHNHLRKFQLLIPKTPPGPIAEFGVFNGGATVHLAGFHRHVFAFDTFEGMPDDTEKTPFDPLIDFRNPPGKFKPRTQIIELLSQYPNITCIKGVFQDTLPVFDPKIKFAFVYLDCDWYSSYKYVVSWLSKRVMPNAVALVDDYPGCEGCVRAITEMVNEKLIQFDKKSRILTWRSVAPILLL